MMLEPYTPETLPITSIHWPDHVSNIGKAHAALARFDGIVRSMVNPRVLLSPMMTREAVLSSRIEGTRASMEEMLEYEADPKTRFDEETTRDIREQAKENIRKAESIIQLYNEMKMKIPEITRSQYAIQIIDTLFHIPIFTSTSFIGKSGIPKRSVHRILDLLKGGGLIDIFRHGKGQRPVMFVFQPLITVTGEGSD